MADMDDVEGTRDDISCPGEQRPVRILIADDEPVHLFLLEMFLKKWGYQVICVESGNEAWQILDGEDSPRMAILDWQLPGMDGIEICRAVRRSEKRAYTYILLLTARAQKADIQMGLAAGANDYLIKPYDPEELRKRVLAACKQLESPADLPSSEDNRNPGDAGIVAVRGS